MTVDKVTRDNDRGVIARGMLMGRMTEIVRYDRAGKFYAEWEDVDESGRRRQVTDLNETIQRVQMIVAGGGEYFPGVARRVDREVTMTDCYDCGAEPGAEHHDGCDIARCMRTGGQRLQCELGLYAEVVRALRRHGEHVLADDVAYHVGLDDEAHDCGRDVWTGEWPGTVECREFGWYAWFGPDLGRTGWVKIDADEVEHFRLLHPGEQVSEDLNRLAVEAAWDASAGRWVKTTGGER